MRTDSLGFGGLGEPAPIQRGQWGRRIVSSMVLCASVTALTLLLVDQGNKGRFGPTEAGAFHSPPAPSTEDRAWQAATDTAVMQAEEARYRALSEFVSRRYYVSQDAALDMVTLAHRAGRQLQLDPLLIIAVMAIESRFNPFAESAMGAQGLMQLMPETARRYGVSDAFDPEQNIQGGTRYLADLIARFGRENLELVLAAYNAGETAVAKYGNRIPPYRETLHYVPNVIRLFRALSARETRTAGG